MGGQAAAPGLSLCHAQGQTPGLRQNLLLHWLTHGLYGGNTMVGPLALRYASPLCMARQRLATRTHHGLCGPSRGIALRCPRLAMCPLPLPWGKVGCRALICGAPTKATLWRGGHEILSTFFRSEVDFPRVRELYCTKAIHGTL